MSWSTAEETRIEAIEEVLTNVQQAINNLMSKLQYRQLVLLKQTEIDALTTRVEALESQVTVLQNEI